MYCYSYIDFTACMYDKSVMRTIYTHESILASLLKNDITFTKKVVQIPRNLRVINFVDLKDPLEKTKN